MTEPRTQPLEGLATTGQALGPIGFTVQGLFVSSCLWGGLCSLLDSYRLAC